MKGIRLELYMMLNKITIEIFWFSLNSEGNLYLDDREDYFRQSSENIFANYRKNFSPVIGKLFYYSCDAVVHLKNGKYGLIEIKLGGDKLIEEGAKSLKSVESKIDTDKMLAPSFLMVLTGTGDYAYRRHDGVYVIPIGCLKN